MNTKNLKVFGILISGLVLLTACAARTKTIQGSGNVISESRDVSGFDGVSHTGIGQVIITQGGGESLTIEADDNLMEYITSEVNGGTLELGFKEDVRFDPTPSIVFRVNVNDLTAIDSVGTGSIEMVNLDTEQLELSTSGTGSITIEKLTAADLVVAAEGTGTINIAGTVESQEVDRVGTGDYEAPDLESRTASVNNTGTGSVVIWVLDSLDVVIDGTGEVGYFGSPSVTESITGTGSLTGLGNK